MRKIYISAIFSAIVLLSSIMSVHAQEAAFYYKIGGARPVSAAPSLAYNYTIGIDLNLGGAFQCGKFDPKATVANLLGQVKNGVDQFQQAMVQAAQSAISALPMLLLQRLNPGLYDIFQNALLDAKAMFNISVASCQNLIDDQAKGINPWENWIKVGRWQTWKDKGSANPGDAVNAYNQAQSNPGVDGIPWVCSNDSNGRAGGDGQRAIQPVRDAIVAGYNIIAGRVTAANPGQLCDTSPATSSSSNSTTDRLKQAFPNGPDDAANFATQILGDSQVYLRPDAFKQQAVGSGVLPIIERETPTITSRLNNLVNNTGFVSADDRQSVSAPQVEITNIVITSLRNYPPPQRDMLIQRLASEVAVSRAIDRLLLTRRMLLSARDLAVVRNSAAVDTINESIREMAQQIDELTYESNIRKEMISSTAAQILQIEGTRRNEAFPIPTQSSSPPLQQGAPTKPDTSP